MRKTYYVEKRYLRTKNGKMKLLILRPNNKDRHVPGVLWIHGGGYMTGMAEMAFFSRAMDVVKSGAVVVAPSYTLSWKKPYPAAIQDCYAALLYLRKHTEELGVRSDQIFVGGESAGGGLTAAVCMYARDQGEVNVAYQMPLYPMLDCEDTESSRDNYGIVWNTVRNHSAWKVYLRKLYGKENVSPYASPSRQTDYSNLPPAYTFVCKGEPFYCETLTYVENLKKEGIPAFVDVYKGKVHAFDMMMPWTKQSRIAAGCFKQHFLYAVNHYRAEQKN